MTNINAVIFNPKLPPPPKPSMATPPKPNLPLTPEPKLPPAPRAPCSHTQHTVLRHLKPLALIPNKPYFDNQHFACRNPTALGWTTEWPSKARSHSQARNGNTAYQPSTKSPNNLLTAVLWFYLVDFFTGEGLP